MQDCKVVSSLDFDSDHRALVAKLRTPTTKSKRPTKPAWNDKPRNSNNEDYTQLANNEISNKYFQTLESILRKNSNSSQCVCTNDIEIRSSTLIDNIKAASKQSLPKRLRSSDDPTQAWKNDKELNDILAERFKKITSSHQCKVSTKAIRKRRNISKIK